MVREVATAPRTANTDSSLARLIRAQVCDRLFYLADYLFMSDFED